MATITGGMKLSNVVKNCNIPGQLLESGAHKKQYLKLSKNSMLKSGRELNIMATGNKNVVAKTRTMTALDSSLLHNI